MSKMCYVLAELDVFCRLSYWTTLCIFFGKYVSYLRCVISFCYRHFGIELFNEKAITTCFIPNTIFLV